MNDLYRGLRSIAASIAVGFALTACGGGGGSAFNGTAAPGSASKSITLSISLPGAALAASKSIRRPASGSSTAGSISVSINGGTPQVVNLSSANCTGTSLLVCTITVLAPFGPDTFTIVTYSGANATGSQVNETALTINVNGSTPATVTVTAGTLLVVTSSADASGGSYSCASGSTTCTLREAVAEASTTAGNPTTITFQGVSTITVGSPISISSTGNQSIAILGPGATAVQSSAGAPSASSGLTISGGNSSQIFLINAGGSLVVDGLTLSGGVSSDGYGGGAIENHGGLSIINTVLSGNSAAGEDYGGAVYDDGVNTNVSYSTFSGNTAYEGGAYWEDNGATFNYCLFNGNSAFNATYNYGEGGAIDAYWNLSVTSSTFTANVAGSMTAASGAYAYGGAIAFWDGTTSLTVIDSTFGGSSASLGNSAVTAAASSYTGGGAIYDQNDNELPTVLSNNTFGYNKVLAYGAYGSAVVASYSVNGSGDTYTNNIADGSTEQGYAGATLYSDDYPSTLTNETFTGNSATGYYDAYAAGAYLYWVTGSNLTFSNNSATASGYQYAEAYAGGLEVEYGSLSNATFSGNSATAGYYASGGGLYIEEEGFALSNASFTSNSVSAGSASSAGYVEGGGLYDDPPSLNSPQAARLNSQGSHSHILTVLAIRDKLRAADAARLAATPVAARKGAAFPRSSKAAARGTQLKTLAIAVPLPQSRVSAQSVSPQSGTITWSNLTFTGNTASGGLNGYAYGGGMLFDDYQVPVTATVTSNAATVPSGGSSNGAYGGGIFNYYDMIFTGTVTNNTATNGGGGVYSEDYFQATNSTFSGNSVTGVAYSYDGGGGIYNDDDLVLTNSTVSANTVAGSVAGTGGGGIFNYYLATLTNVTLFNNTSSQNGGGIENQNSGGGCASSPPPGCLTAVNVTIFNNTATVAGGSIDSSWTLKLQNTIAAGGMPSSSEINNTSTLLSGDYNLIQGTVVGSFTAASHDKLGVSPALASGLANNGGPTATIADTSSSPGAGYIPFAGGCGTTGPNVDQRGYTRGTGGVCDIGAFELNGIAP